MSSFNPDTVKIELAGECDKSEILGLYRSMIGGKADWNEHYPSMETIEFDMSYNSLFVMKNESGEIISAVSIDHDEEVEALDCWSDELQPSGEVSRVCVRNDMQNNGIARIMMTYVFEVLRKCGKKSVHILVRPQHTAALKSYSHLGFTEVGKCRLFEKDFLCFEREL